MSRYNKNSIIAITAGEPAGIGSEITMKAWEMLRRSGPSFILVGSRKQFSVNDHRVRLVKGVEEVEDTFKHQLPVYEIDGGIEFEVGVPNTKTSKFVLSSISQSVEMVASGKCAALVTNPIQKSVLNDAGFSFPGHTEYLAYLTNQISMPANRTRGCEMLLWSEEVCTLPLTIHIPLAEVPLALTRDRIIQSAIVLNEALVKDFGIEKPRIALAGINPHAGEDGKIGSEELSTFLPALEELRKRDLNILGPLSADTLFTQISRNRFDVCMMAYHDQALIPVKTLAFDDAVNVTIGLPIIRTSPDHGTGLDIAGKGIASPNSLVAAINLASRLAVNRQSGTVQS